MEALKITKKIDKDGTLLLENIPARQGDMVEVILLIKQKNDKDKLLELAGLMTENEADEFASIIKKGKTIKQIKVDP